VKKSMETIDQSVEPMETIINSPVGFGS